MKALTLTLALAAFGNAAQASGLYQEALNQTLASESLKTTVESFKNFELTTTETKKVESRRDTDAFVVTLFYSAIGTAGGCYVDAKVLHSQMELVKPGGGGFEIRDIWEVDAEKGECPR